MPLMTWATHVLQWEVQRVARPRGHANLLSFSQFGLQAATRLHEAGIASDRDQHAAAVNTFPGLVHTARHTTRVCNTRSR